MEQIQNFEAYTKLMKNGNYDKLFFVDKLFGDWEQFVDYGCADGLQTLAIAEVFPNKTIIGYDSNFEMILAAKENLRKNHPNLKNVFFVNNLHDIAQPIDVLYFSSIIHEVYAYCSMEEIEKFWNLVFSSNSKYIIIRDMIFDELIDRPSDVNIVRNVRRYCVHQGINDKLREFEKAQGRIENYKNLIHFLLKYPYTETGNWSREVYENYLKLSIQKLYELIPSNYRIQYEENYTLPYFKNKWEEDFGFFIDEKIHSKFILKRI